MSEKEDSKPKLVVSHEEGLYILWIKMHQEDIKTINIYTLKFGYPSIIEK